MHLIREELKKHNVRNSMCHFYWTFDQPLIRIHSQSDTICSFVEPSLTIYSTELFDFGNYEIHSIELYHNNER